MLPCINLCKSEFHRPARTTVDGEGSDVCIGQTGPTRMGYLVHLPLCSLDPGEDWSRLFVHILHHNSIIIRAISSCNEYLFHCFLYNHSLKALV